MKHLSVHLLVCLALTVVFVGGCREAMPHSATWPYSGDQIPSHPKPPEGGYYTDWDPWSVKLEATPVSDINPVRTQHVFVATVLDKDGKPLPNRRIEWIIAEGSVGDIIEVDESGIRASRGYKMTNKFAVSHTNNGEHVLDRGNNDPSDDIHLGVGQTWAVITSPVEGTTHMIVYAPGIADWDKHKVFVEKHWYDVEVDYPPNATNRVGTPHQFTTRVTKSSDGSPLAGYEVTYNIVSGPAASFGGGQSQTVTTDAQGLASVTLTQDQMVEGANGVDITVVRPANLPCCIEAITLGNGHVQKNWVAPAIAICKKAPREVYLGDEFKYVIGVSNPSGIVADNVMVSDNLPAGIEFVSSNPPANVSGQALTWNMGNFNGGQSQDIVVTVRSTQTGTFENCAQVQAQPGLSDRACATTRVVQAALVVEKTAPAEVILCDPIPYKIVVRNTGDAAARNVRLEEALPDGLVAQGGRTKVVSDIGTLAAGQSKVVHFSARAQRAGTFVNTATATADRGLTAQATAQTVVLKPALSITKVGPAQRFLNREIAYQITVTNTGNAPAKNTVLTDAIPAGAMFVSAANGGSMSGGQVMWQLGTLEVGASKTVSVTMKGVRIGTVRNVVNARAFCAEATAEATTEVIGIPAMLLECVDVDDPIEVGQQNTYRITVTNQGTAQATNVVVSCTLPAEEQFVSAGGPVGHQAQGQTVSFQPLGTLAPRAQAVYTVTVKGLRAGDVRFAVQMQTDEMDSPVNETESTRFYD